MSTEKHLADDTPMTEPVARSELDEATFVGDLKRMEKLLKAGCPVDESSPPGDTGAHYIFM